MTPTSMELVERLYQRLVEAVIARGGAAGESLTIGELYQNLIPYRGVRGDLGVLELAEYEHALLRLLVGEGGFLRMQDDVARRELEAELAAPNPILGIYRDYAGLGVELVGAVESNGASSPELAESREAEMEDEELESVRDVSELTAEDADQEGADGPLPPLPEMSYPAPRPFAADATRVANVPAPPAPAPAVESAEGTAGECAFCYEPLPDVEGLRFCPNCGADQTEVPCDRCAAPVRVDWNFCIRCGAPRPSD